MKKTLALFAAVSGLSLVGAAPPSEWNDGGLDSAGGYPPCSATITDRCIQLYERGVATPANLAMNEQLGTNAPGLAMGGPYEPLEYEDDVASNWEGHDDELAMGADIQGDDYAADWSEFEDHSQADDYASLR